MPINLKALVLFISIVLAFICQKLVEYDDVILGKTISRDEVPPPSRILLLTAHPDDECMFFAPTVLSLVSQLKSDPLSSVFALCLSIGDADGLGELRRTEFNQSLDILGIDPYQRWIIDHPNLQDNITTPWDSYIIAEIVRPYIAENRITTILTFDYEGISSHPNHKSLPRGIQHLIANHVETPSHPLPRLFTLITLPLLSKYTGIFASVSARSSIFWHRIVLHFNMQVAHLLRTGSHSITPPTKPTGLRHANPIFISGFSEYWQALCAMRAHRSQLVWFRWLYVTFSRYMWVNTWIEVQ